MITDYEKKVLLNIIGHDRNIAETYQFLRDTLIPENKYSKKERELSIQLISYLDGMNEEQRKQLIKDARTLTNTIS